PMLPGVGLVCANARGASATNTVARTMLRIFASSDGVPARSRPRCRRALAYWATWRVPTPCPMTVIEADNTSVRPADVIHIVAHGADSAPVRRPLQRHRRRWAKIPCDTPGLFRHARPN